MYDYLNHFKNYGFNWEDNKIGLRYFVKKVGTKIQKRLTSKNTRKMIVLDEQRMFNVHYSIKRDLSDIKKKFFTIAMAYLWNPYNPRKDAVFNFESLTKRQKIDFLINFSFSKHYQQPAKIGSNFLISAYSGNIIMLWLKSNNEIVLQTGWLK